MKYIQFLALVLTTLALVPAGAHLLELANKMELAETDYFIVQTIYRGWALLGTVTIAALLANLTLAIATRGQGPAFAFAVLAFVCMAASLAVFFAFTYPANVATENWTAIPAGWEALRWKWEMSHAAGALITFVAFCATALSVLSARR
ncbi:DUF1772 domain-containing protein [Pseudolabrys taiwanensis]|uniref:DUF1772 domain-containing protein n=1 Tax=Pseudolabrys taiwanensis TaxID=331696 RepID=A0A345ZT20_9HYPH|nr:DUF1772 domain-containing protein [Pseudolabrys taiwanensis]AXK80067.1 DUF1772 domain-containing protein [Pseudolabrys taiwanensis]